MAKFYTDLTQSLVDFIRVQPILFVATAPRAGRINLSPKGINSGQGSVIRPSAPGWDRYASSFDLLPGTRQIILDWATAKGEEGVKAYQHQKNQRSIDGLPTNLLKTPDDPLTPLE